MQDRLASTWTLNGVAGRKQEMIRVAKVINATKIKFGIRVSVFFARRFMKDFRAQSEIRSYFTLQKPAGKPPIAVVFARIDPIAAAAVSCPRRQSSSATIEEEILAHVRCPSRARGCRSVFRRAEKHRSGEDGRFLRRSDISFRVLCRHSQSVWLHETALLNDTGRDQMKLQVRKSAVIDLEVRRGA